MRNILYTNLNLFDGVHNEVKDHAWLWVNGDGKISKVGTGTQPDADRMVDLHDQYVMPGMINVHTHVWSDPNTFNGDGGANLVKTTVRAVRHLHELLKSGVTYVRGCGSNHEMLDITLSRMQANGSLKHSPRIMPAGRPITMTGGHFVTGNAVQVDSPDEMRKAVRKNFADGAKCTKVIATGGVTSITDNMKQPQLKIPEMRTAVEETHSKGSIVAAHAEANPGIMNAIKAGVDSIEHGCYVTNQEIKMMLKRGTYLTPTLEAPWCILTHKDELPSWEVKKTMDCFHDTCKNIKNAYHQGVKITLGTDAGNPFNTFDKTPGELALMVDKLGMSNFDALSTSRHSAELMKLNNYGTLEPGKYADFLTLERNPLDNIKAVQQKDKGVYQHGIKQD